MTAYDLGRHYARVKAAAPLLTEAELLAALSKSDPDFFDTSDGGSVSAIKLPGIHEFELEELGPLSAAELKQYNEERRRHGLKTFKKPVL